MAVLIFTETGAGQGRTVSHSISRPESHNDNGSSRTTKFVLRCEFMKALVLHSTAPLMTLILFFGVVSVNAQSGQTSTGISSGLDKIWTSVPIHPKVLPKGASLQQLSDIMIEWRAAIGGHCHTCHTLSKDPTNLTEHGTPQMLPYVDSLPQYNKARKMYSMTQKINQTYVPSAKAQVRCGTCHRGKEIPEAYIAPPMALPPSGAQTQDSNRKQ